MDREIAIMVLSGVEDGALIPLNMADDGELLGIQWRLSIGRREDNHLRLRNDTFVSRYHAYLHWRDDQWWLEDRDSTNGTFLDNGADFFNDIQVKGIVPIQAGQPFRVGRTWLRIQADE